MNTEGWQIVWFTAWVSVLSVLLILPFGVGAAWLLARRGWPGKTLVETILTLPLVMPPVATGLILLQVLGRRGLIGGFLEEKAIARGFFLLTDKPTIFAANVKESELATADANPHVKKVREYAKTHIACETVVISAQIESDLVDLSPEEAKEFLKELGVQESGMGSLIRSTYHLLGLRTYFTAGEKEVRAWTIHTGDTAPKAAGVIHSDFERGFIKAETVAYEDLVKCGSVAAAREKGLYRMEGKEYVVQDGDVMLFKFNV